MNLSKTWSSIFIGAYLLLLGILTIFTIDFQFSGFILGVLALIGGFLLLFGK